MTGKDTTLEGPDGAFSAYEAGTGPAIIVLQEIFGVNAVMRGICDELADEGFKAICPDLFWRIEPGIQITDKTEAEWQRAFALFGQFDVNAGLTDIAATIDYGRQAGTGKVGALGYCLGGQLAFLTACRTSADACVGYYGVNIQEWLSESATITHPLMLHIAGNDEYVPPAAQKKILDGLGANRHVTLHAYKERAHAFARVGGAHYHATDAELANSRTRAFFKEHLS